MHLCLGMAHGQLGGALRPRDFSDPMSPIRLVAVLDRIEESDRAAFPDEITVGPPELLEVHLEATIDEADNELVVTKRFFPHGGHPRAPSKTQLKAIGFEYVSASRSLSRELSGVSGGTVRNLLSSIDLAGDEATLEAAAGAYQNALEASDTLRTFRRTLAGALSESLPSPIEEADVRLMTEGQLMQQPLSGVSITVRDGEHDAPLAEQSDGIRALSLLSLLAIAQKSANIVAVDEPETHLHPIAAKAVAQVLNRSADQRVIVTHSPAVVSKLNPLDVIAFGSDRRPRQLGKAAIIGDEEKAVRFWSHRLIEPLTARHVILVEGVGDRIVLERVASLVGIDLERKGVSIFELDGKDQFGLAYKVLGPEGFNVPLCGLLDEDARTSWATSIGVLPGDIEAEGYGVCSPDLEAMYIDALGVSTVRDILAASHLIGETRLLQATGVTARSDIDRAMLLAFCSHKKRKVTSALAVTAALDATMALALVPIHTVLMRVS
jgi:putative ATP-dependent endonuclease of OLD family